MDVQSKPSVGILIRALDMGGAEKQSLLQAKLMRSEFNIHYIIQKDKPKLRQHVDFIEAEKLNYIQLSGNIFSRTSQLISYIKKNKIIVLFSFLPLDNLLASLVSIFVKITYVGGIRNSHLPFVKFYANWFLQKFFLDYIIYNNHFGRDAFIKRGYSSENAIVIQNCINNIQDEITRPDKNTLQILSVGRFTTQKDYLTSLKAIDLLKKMPHGKDIEYVIVGDGELDQQINNWIKDLQLANVTIVKNPHRLESYYRDADIYFLSSIYEGLPNSIMEALNYSLPVVSTDVGDASFLVKDGENGYIVPVRDYKMLAEKLFKLVCDAKIRTEFGLKGHELLIKEFSEAKFQEKYNKLTMELILHEKPLS